MEPQKTLRIIFLRMVLFQAHQVTKVQEFTLLLKEKYLRITLDLNIQFML